MGLDLVEMVMALEEEFDVSLPDHDLARMHTVGQLYQYINNVLGGPFDNAASSPYSGPVWERYLDVIERETAVRRERLRPEADFVKNLRLG